MAFEGSFKYEDYHLGGAHGPDGFHESLDHNAPLHLQLVSLPLSQKPINPADISITNPQISHHHQAIFYKTGGTFDSQKTDDGYQPTVNDIESMALLPKDLRDALLVIPRGSPDHFGAGIDSVNMTVEKRIRILNFLERSLKHGPALPIIVTHGTDTMAETATFLSIMLPNPSQKIIYTGAMRGITEPDTDAIQNAADALVAANSPDLPPGHYIVFNGRVIAAHTAVKISTVANDSFRSVNEEQDIAHIRNGALTMLAEPLPRREPVDTSVYKTVADNWQNIKVGVNNLDEEFTADSLRETLLNGTPKKHAYVIQALGNGALPDIFTDVVAECSKKIPILVTSKTAIREAADGVYAVEQQVLRRGIMVSTGMNMCATITNFKLCLARFFSQERVGVTGGKESWTYSDQDLKIITSRWTYSKLVWGRASKVIQLGIERREAI